MEVVLIRHTRTAAAPGLCYGQLDVPLANTADADILATLADVPRVDAVFSSPLQRCATLARALAARDGSPLDLSASLQELSFGAWEGKAWDEVPRDQSDPWALEPWTRAAPGGEPESALWRRVANWYGATLAGGSGRVAVVAHAGPLRILRCLLLGLPAARRWDQPFDYGRAHVISRDS